MAKLDKLLKAGKKVATETVSRAKKEVPELRVKLDKLKPKPKPKKPKSFLKERRSKQRKEDALKLAGLYGTTIPTATLMGMGIADRQEQSRKAAEKRRKEELKKKREAAKKKGNKTFTVDGLRYDTSTGRRKPLSAAPLLEATQRRIDYEKSRDKKPVKKAGGGMAVKSSSRKSKPRGVGVALRGYGRALR